ncbi:hypothetical protein MWN33_08905 [Starkeya koreensis]|uniref:Uncharacterized protein n=1 Tax=Ancylobacter koreensis TaxID=266121 RepID=A0ABT0DLJ6_9HYPH|nr:hypothetical protein [Ancylobacter koreensis]MCK0208147.1 hypothetical protein [Ancylobacter koreensis]
MPFTPSLFDAVRDRVPGRLLLPVGFALFLAVGTYVIAENSGYERGKAAQASAEESVRNLARLVAQPIELDEEPTEKGDRLLPTMVRAIEPSAVYRAPTAHAAKPAKASVAAGSAGVASAEESAAAALPAGVERFDHCQGACETRDPKVVRAAYPVLVESPEATAARAARRPDVPFAEAPRPDAPPALVTARAEAPEEGFLGLPPLPTAGEIVDRTVQGTSQAYDSMKQAVSGAIDFLR